MAIDVAVDPAVVTFARNAPSQMPGHARFPRARKAASAIPVGGQTRLDIPNDHLSYAITWFLIALALAGVYLAYHWENGRLTVAGHTKGKT